MLLHAFAYGRVTSAFAPFRQSGYVGRRRRRRRTEDVGEHPFPPQHRRGTVGIRGDRQKTPVPEDSAAAGRFRLVEHDASKMTAVDVGDAVMTGEPLVEERVVGIQQL